MQQQCVVAVCDVSDNLMFVMSWILFPIDYGNEVVLEEHVPA